jgi:pilus assembly protein CpaF
MSWSNFPTTLSNEQVSALVEESARSLGGLSLATLRDRNALAQAAEQAVRASARNLGLPLPPAHQLLAKVGGLGFLDALLPPASFAFTDLLLNGDGSVWGRRKGAMRFERLDLHPSVAECWRAVEALLSPQGRACSEATPSVDAKLPRDKAVGFGGARVKVLHPRIAAGDGYPSLALRLYEKIVQWGVLPQAVMDGLLAAVSKRLRVMVIGGTATGKTTLLAALCHGIETTARIVKVEDPEEIWLPHPNVTTLEARPAPPGSDVAAYTVADGVDDALRLAPSHLIVGEVRTGNAALSLLRALMSDHAGLTTFHADGPQEALFRLSVILYADAQVRFEAAKALCAQAIDLLVHVGWQEERRTCLGVWEVAGMNGNNVDFRALWEPGQETMEEPQRKRA